jgi:WD40 repeat protein
VVQKIPGRAGKLLDRLNPDSVWDFRAACFSPGRGFVATGSIDGLMQVWEIASGREIGRCREPWGSRVERLAFSPDGNVLGSAHANGSCILWPVGAMRLPRRQGSSHR